MALTDPYITAAQYKLIFDKTTATEDAEIEADVLAVMDWMDNDLGRFFNKAGATSNKSYTVPDRSDVGGGAMRLLEIDDVAVGPVSVTIDDNDDGTAETLLGAGDFRLTPINAQAAGRREDAPFTGIEIPRWSTRDGWPSGLLVVVAADWGWPQIPKAIERGCGHLVGILRTESPRATGQIADGLDSVIQASRESQRIVGDLRKHYRRLKF